MLYCEQRRGARKTEDDLLYFVSDLKVTTIL